jgi:hypothetical protein
MEIPNKALTDRIIAAAILLNFATARLTVKRVGREYHPTSKGEDVAL